MNFRQFFTTNRWWGKLIGAFVGYLLGGSTGALFGILIGNLFDRGLFDHYSRPHWHYHSEKRQAVQKIFFHATFAVMGHIAKSDGHVSEQELHTARILMDEMRLNQDQKKMAKLYFTEGKAADFDLAAMLTSLQQTCQDNPDLLKLFMDIQYRAAQTDGLSEKKIQALDVVFKRMGFAPLRDQYRFYDDFGYGTYSRRSSSSSQQSGRQGSNSYQQRPNYQRPENSLAQAYALLEISPSATKQEVKRAYRRLISRNHPDKLIAQGLPEEMIKIATDKTQKITKAYEQICETKGW